MRVILGLFTIFFVQCALAELHCEHKKPDIPTEWLDLHDSCTNVVKAHIMEELKAALQYMAMGAHFSRDQVNRPGFAKLFFNAASEEREHAVKLIHYLLMRGKLTDGVTDLVIKNNLAPSVTEWADAASALRDALKLEATVTNKIKTLISVCDGSTAATNINDYHLADYLTGEFLTEQYEGQRDLAGKLSNLDKMMDSHGVLGEFLFDKKLL
ncbi:ferritin heavy chain-like [Euwallacea fornicatus]|uniref:ferritin heavy chain-like n=1 Tax=Euwallacea fornicatus TaxID=995702 RepID=UPI0033902306